MVGATTLSNSLVLLGLSLPLGWLALKRLSRARRSDTISRHAERVLVIGASSGIGCAIALLYAERGAKLCLVGRRAVELEDAREECGAVQKEAGRVHSSGVLSVVADFADAGDMVRVREILDEEWGGLDTLIVSAGVSALQPLMHLAGVEGRSTDADAPTVEGIQNTADIASAATKGNYLGPLVSAVTLIPFLSKSPSPSILLISSLAAAIPAPTRTLYTSTKAASFMLYRSLSIEHPNIKFSYILPSTVEGDFRASAVDSGPVREADPNKHGLKKATVAARSVRAIDDGEGIVFMPAFYWWAHLLYWFFPSFVGRQASRKYNFSV